MKIVLNKIPPEIAARIIKKQGDMVLAGGKHVSREKALYELLQDLINEKLDRETL